MGAIRAHTIRRGGSYLRSKYLLNLVTGEKAILTRLASTRFEDWFSKYAKGKDGVTLDDVFDAHKGQRVIFDPIGWIAEALECERIYAALFVNRSTNDKDDLTRACHIYHALASRRSHEEGRLPARLRRQHLL